MNYKALEDLINILIRKIGYDLNQEVSDYKKNKVKNRLNILKSSSNVKDYEEIKVLEKILNSWDDNIEKNVKFILMSFKEKKPYEYVKNKVDYLTQEAKKELKTTESEIRDSNIFKIIEQYKETSNSIQKGIKESNYNDPEKEKLRKFYNSYITSKNNSLNQKNSNLEKQIISLKKLIEILKIQQNKNALNIKIMQEKLLVSKEKTYSNEIKLNTLEQGEQLENVVISIEEEIENNKSIESFLLQEIENYEEEIKEKEKHIAINLEIINTTPINVNTKNNVKYLSDLLKYYRNEARLNSISLEQQYLYVNPDIIAEEIEKLWRKSTSEEIEIFE